VEVRSIDAELDLIPHRRSHPRGHSRHEGCLRGLPIAGRPSAGSADRAPVEADRAATSK
jgi:hypothetical protein